MNAAIGLAVAAIGSLSAMAAPLWAQATSEPVSQWIPAGSAGVAVGGLVYVAKKLASGELVSVNIAEVMASSQRTASEAVELIASSMSREETLRQLVVNNTEAMTATHAAVAELTRTIALERKPTRARAAKKST